jgi:hypothetical protein
MAAYERAALCRDIIGWRDMIRTKKMEASLKSTQWLRDPLNGNLSLIDRI